MSRRILAKFSQGSDLFPADPLSELAEMVMNSPALPTDAAERIVRDVIDDPQGKPGTTVTEIFSLLQDFGGVTLSGDIGIPDMERINDELDRVWAQRRGGFFTGIGFRMVRTRKG